MVYLILSHVTWSHGLPKSNWHTAGWKFIPPGTYNHRHLSASSSSSLRPLATSRIQCLEGSLPNHYKRLQHKSSNSAVTSCSHCIRFFFYKEHVRYCKIMISMRCQMFASPKDLWTLKTGNFEDPTPVYRGSNPSIGGSKILRVACFLLTSCHPLLHFLPTKKNARQSHGRRWGSQPPLIWFAAFCCCWPVLRATIWNGWKFSSPTNDMLDLPPTQ